MGLGGDDGFSSKSLNTVTVALVLWRQSGIKLRGNWVRLRPYEPCLRGMSRSTRSRAYTWLREAGLIETRSRLG